MLKTIAATATATACALLAGCSTSNGPTSSETISGPAATIPATPTARTPTGSGASTRGQRSGRVDKLVTFIVENKTFGQMRAQMPWVAQLADRYGYAADYRALTHPSLPNYLAIAGGSLFGVADDDPPSAHPVSGPSIFGRALAVGSTAALYAEDMNGTCELEPDGRYAVKHNPWAYFVDERDTCAQHDVPLDRLANDIRTGSLPDVGMVIPNMCNDAHDCPLSVANDWLQQEVGQMMTGPDWKSGRLAIVITADEDDGTEGNHILTVVAHPSLDHVVVETPLTHDALGRAYADVGGFAPLGNSRTAPSLLTAFGLSS
ncbi:MAG: alkaline phosphatase family protein [Nocardioides sp.]|uniref:alkaline phosphatase family protein n=1 Tax=Nocardioides sp. TaxID=35761 RepID=UPI0039E682C2